MTRVLAAAVTLCSALWADTVVKPRGITAEDYFSFITVSDPHFSPDGRWVAYTATRVDQAANRRMSRIWIVASDGTQQPQALTAENSSSTSPRWSPDGKNLAFLSTRDGARVQLWVLPMSGGEAVRLTNLDGGIANIEWSPDS